MTVSTILDLGQISSSQIGTDEPVKLELFPLPLFVWRWQEAAVRKPELVAAVAQRRATSAGIVRTNRNGWHSDTDLPAWQEPAIRDLVSWAARCVEEGSWQWREPHSGPPPDFPGPWRVNGWANVNPPGGHNISHTHAQRNWHWSACYYVDLPGLAAEGTGGALVLEERGTGLKARGGNPWSRQHRYVPSEGELVVFPSWLYHRVEPHAGAADRMTIAFNFYHPALEPSRLWEHRPRWWWRRFPGLLRKIAAYRGTQDWSEGAAPLGYDVVPKA